MEVRAAGCGRVPAVRRRAAGGRVASRLRAEAGQADLPRATAGAELRWVALRRRWPPQPLSSAPPPPPPPGARARGGQMFDTK